MSRLATLKKIDNLLKNHCNKCPIREEYLHKYGRLGCFESKLATQHCNKSCDIGKQLRECGKALMEPKSKGEFSKEYARG